jgi:zinc transport system ATP-binding protein
MSLIAADRICVRFGRDEVLHDISRCIAAGEIVTILGPNGSGKSTLLRALLGIVPVAEGRIRATGGPAAGLCAAAAAIDRTMPMTVRRFLSLPTRVSDRRRLEALARVGMAGHGPRQMTTLSGGQLQRVLLARAAGQPQLLMLDEPTSGLDQPGEASPSTG